MGPISKFPQGLLDLFGLKTLGNYPSQVADIIAPTYDIAHLLERSQDSVSLYTRKRYPAGFGVVGALNQNLETIAAVAVTVPQTKRWLIKSWYAAVMYTQSAAVAQNLPGFAPFITDPIGVPIINFEIDSTMHTMTTMAVIGSYYRQLGACSNCSILVQPASQFQCIPYCNFTVPAGDTLDLLFAFNYVEVLA